MTAMDQPPRQTLPRTLPENPLPLFASWYEEATSSNMTLNPNAFVLATTNDRNEPVARNVLCKQLDADAGFLVFHTNYKSDKGRQLAKRRRAAGVFYWDWLGRQVRLAGAVVQASRTESDAYFAIRDRDSQIGAWASEQSKPVESREAMLAQFAAARERFSTEEEVPRPPHWGGFRFWFDTVELWVAGEHRVHDRARWTRTIQGHEDHFHGGPWRATRLQP
jgi:pyridoxamine 5'-phosphate oxidase